MFNLDRFIGEYVTKRETSMFLEDIKNNEQELIDRIEGQRFLVIGGAGSIGSSFIRAILPFKPASLVVVDTNENALAELTRRLRSSGVYMPPEYIPYPMDYSSKVFKKMFISHKGFDVVANFSAHKHVRSEKDIYSIEALITNNLLHAGKLLELLERYQPKHYFCVSTDKAANPVNIMGASKRIMEDLIFSYSDEFMVSTARFANVAFSNGSLPDGFMHRMQYLQPLSAPLDVKRYFVSPEESGQICMMAGLLGLNREIYFPKLEESQMMSFDKIAESLLEANGYKVLKCKSDEEAIAAAAALKAGSREYPVHFFTSDTSGEKPYEEFYTDDEKINMETYKALGIIKSKPAPNREKVREICRGFEELFDKPEMKKEEVVELIGDYLPNFKHIETGKGLDSKM